MSSTVIFRVGLDVHKDSVTAAVFRNPRRAGEHRKTDRRDAISAEVDRALPYQRCSGITLVARIAPSTTSSTYRTSVPTSIWSKRSLGTPVRWK